MKTKYTVDEARVAIAQKLKVRPSALPSTLLASRGTMELLMYEPREVDAQTPHNQDELYIIHQGTGVFEVGDPDEAPDTTTFKSGDVLFVPAGVPHRFADFSPDLSVWVVFWGTPGGDC